MGVVDIRQVAEIFANLMRQLVLELHQLLHGRRTAVVGKAERCQPLQRVLELLRCHTCGFEFLPEESRLVTCSVTAEFEHRSQFDGCGVLPDLESMPAGMRLLIEEL